MIAASITETASVGNITFGMGLEELRKMGDTHTHWQGMGCGALRRIEDGMQFPKLFFFFSPKFPGLVVFNLVLNFCLPYMF